uniref:AAA family ATPase n=1 Tax=Brachybacterium sp. GPGPB12 TaxID=3023517 RepID=UPI0040493E58
MRLTGVRVKNFRTAGPREQELDLSDTLTIIGPNNSGKTNLLQAIQMLFTGHENIYNYTVAEDSPHGKGARTSIVGYFDGDDEGVDSDFYRDLDRLYAMYNLQRSGKDGRSLPYILGIRKPGLHLLPKPKAPGRQRQSGHN